MIGTDNPENGEDQRPLAYQKLHVDPPPNDGSVVTDFGDGVKIHLFRCMCEERSLDDMKTKEEEDSNNDKEGGGEESGEQNSMKEPTLKNKKEEMEVEEIHKEEKRVEAEEQELKNDPALKDLIDP